LHEYYPPEPDFLNYHFENMNFKPASVAADILRTFGFIVMRQFFDADPLADEIDRVMRDGFASQRITDYGGINFQYVPMMTAETPVSLSLLDRTGALAEPLLGGPVLPTRAKAVRYTETAHGIQRYATSDAALPAAAPTALRIDPSVLCLVRRE
jgi:hypothetical protein